MISKASFSIFCLFLSFSEWMTKQCMAVIVRNQTLLSATSDKNLWRVIIGHIRKGHGTLKNKEISLLFCFLIIFQLDYKLKKAVKSHHSSYYEGIGYMKEERNFSDLLSHRPLVGLHTQESCGEPSLLMFLRYMVHNRSKTCLFSIFSSSFLLDYILKEVVDSHNHLPPEETLYIVKEKFLCSSALYSSFGWITYSRTLWRAIITQILK